jgi:signal transduction histidine kinase
MPVKPQSLPNDAGNAAVVHRLNDTAIELRGVTFEDALHVLARHAREIVGAHQSAISFIPDQDFQRAVHTHSFSQKYEQYNSYDVMPTGDGIWGLIVGKSVSIRMTQDEVESHPLWKNFSGLKDDSGLEHPPMRGWLAVPILNQQDESIGVLQLSDKYNDQEFDQDDQDLLVQVAQLIGPTFELQYVNQALACRTEELRESQAELQKNTDELEQGVKARTAELERSNQALDDFAHIVSHDLRAPLRAIVSLAGWIEQDYAEVVDEAGRESLKLLKTRAIRMNGLVEGVLAYSQAVRDYSEVELVNTHQIAAEVIAALEIPDGIEIHLDDQLPSVRFGRTQLEQILQNLIGNAIRHMDKPNGDVFVSGSDEGDAWSIQIRDTGPGIPEGELERIFQIFQTLESRDRKDTTGIGLTVVKQLVEQQEGTVTVISVVGQGSTFTVTVPKGK